MSRLIYSGLTVPTATQVIQQPGQYVQGGGHLIQTGQVLGGQQLVGQSVVGGLAGGHIDLVQQRQSVVGPHIDLIRQQALAQPAQVTEVITQQPQVVQTVQQVVEGPPQSVGPVQTTVQQQQTQLGESRFEYIPKEKTWVEYEQVQSTEYVPKEVKLTDHYAVEHITEYHPKVFQDTYVDYYPQERLQERVEYQQQVKKVNHPPVSSEITETILQSIPGPQTLIQSQSQVVETGKTENITNIQSTTIGQANVPLVGSRIVQGAPQIVSGGLGGLVQSGGLIQAGGLQQVVQQAPMHYSTVGQNYGQQVYGSTVGQQVVYGGQVCAPQVLTSQPLVASRVVSPQVYGTTVVGGNQCIIPNQSSRVVIQR